MEMTAEEERHPRLFPSSSSRTRGSSGWSGAVGVRASLQAGSIGGYPVAMEPAHCMGTGSLLGQIGSRQFRKMLSYFAHNLNIPAF